MARLRRAASAIGGARRSARSGDRLYVELRALSPPELERIRRPLETAIESLPGVRWARVNPILGRVVVEVAPVDDAALIDAVARLERELGFADRPFDRAHPEAFPGDREPLARTLVELAAEATALVAGAVLARIGTRRLPIEIDLVAAIAAIRDVPPIRKAIERGLSIAFTELGLELAGAFAGTLVHGQLGPVLGLLHRGLRYRELKAREALWPAWEKELCADPEHHAVAPPSAGERPAPLPPGPIERHSDSAVAATVGAFGAALASTRRVADAAAAVFAGLPRPASVGREAFAAHLGVRLARAGMLVIDPHKLRRLDRITAVAISAPVIELPGGRALLARAERAGLTPEVVAAGDEGRLEIRRMQLAGDAVMAIAAGPDAALGAADVAVALHAPGATPPWGADILCAGGAADAAFLIDAAAAARTASVHGIRAGIGEGALALGLGLAGLDSRTTRRIMASANLAAVLSIANGVRLAAGLTRIAAGADDQPPWHAMTAAEVLSRLDSAPAGLDAGRAAERRRPPPPEPSALASFGRMMYDELATPMTPMLAAGAGLSALIGEPVDAALVAGVLVANGVFGGAQRFRAERAVRRLDDEERSPVRVRRPGLDVVERDPSGLVPGDVIELASGDVVPADCRIVEATNLEADESALTGESLPVAKSAAPCDAGAVADRRSMLYQGTSVAAGEVTAVVVAVGELTESRRALSGIEAPSAGGVEARLETIASITLPAAALGGAALGAVSWLRGRAIRDVLGAVVSLTVAAVPEGLPLLATMAQLATADRLSTRGALVRNPRAVEALGRVDVVCADKTGTLTEGRIRLQSVSDGEVEQAPGELDAAHREILAIARRASPSTERANGPSRHMTDRAVIDGADEIDVGSHDDLVDWARLDELPFEPSRAYHAGLARHAGGAIISVKGAPEVVAPLCSRWRRGDRREPLDDLSRRRLHDQAAEMARRGLRVLAVAERAAERTSGLDVDRLHDLTFRGFVGLADPPRQAARTAIARLRAAGVSTVMVTGDHPTTAEAIATELGLIGDRRDGQVIAGADLERMSDAELAARVESVAVFARVSPAQKVRIVEALQRAGKVVAMTGDGANDAAAIRLADVGIAIGGRATPAARRAADMVVTDERIETIVEAALEGRALWASVRDAVSLLVGGNLGEIAFTVIAGLIDGRSPLNARQLLLVNLFTDSLPALAIALRPPPPWSAAELSREGPEASLGAALTNEVLWRGAVTAGSAAAAYTVARLTGTRARASTVALLALTGSQLGQTLASGARSRSVVLTSVGSMLALVALVETPGLSRFFGCRPLGPLGLLQASAVTAAATGAALALPKIAHWWRARRPS